MYPVIEVSRLKGLYVYIQLPLLCAYYIYWVSWTVGTSRDD